MLGGAFLLSGLPGALVGELSLKTVAVLGWVAFSGKIVSFLLSFWEIPCVQCIHIRSWCVMMCNVML